MKRTEHRISLGLWAIGNSKGFHDSRDPRKAKDEIKDAWRDGIRSFDTAFSYHADQLLYSALRELGVRTDEAETIEKVMPVPTFRRKTEACLRALHSERVTYLLLHWPAGETAVYGALREAERLKEEGKALHIGVSNFPPDLTARISADFDISLSERAFSPAWVKNGCKETVPLALYGIFGFGTLFHEDPPDDARGGLYMYSHPEEWRALLSELEKAERAHGTGRAEVLWAFASERAERIIVGSGNRDYLRSDITLTEEEWNSIYRRAEALSDRSGSDNIFSHRWRNE